MKSPLLIRKSFPHGMKTNPAALVLLAGLAAAGEGGLLDALLGVGSKKAATTAAPTPPTCKVTGPPFYYAFGACVEGGATCSGSPSRARAR